MCSEPQTERRRHGHLQVGIARHEHVLILLALLLQFCEEVVDGLGHEFQLMAGKQLQVHQHLVVARAAGVNFLAHVAKLPCQHQFYLRVDILDALLYHKLALDSLLVDAAQLFQEHGQLVLADEADALQHGDVGHGAQHVVGCQIEVQLAVAAHGEALYLAVYLKVLFPEFHIFSVVIGSAPLLPLPDGRGTVACGFCGGYKPLTPAPPC